MLFAIISITSIGIIDDKVTALSSLRYNIVVLLLINEVVDIIFLL